MTTIVCLAGILDRDDPEVEADCTRPTIVAIQESESIGYARASYNNVTEHTAYVDDPQLPNRSRGASIAHSVAFTFKELMVRPGSVDHTCNICLDTLGANGGVSTLLCGKPVRRLKRMHRADQNLLMTCVLLSLVWLQVTRFVASALRGGRQQVSCARSAGQTSVHLSTTTASQI